MANVAGIDWASEAHEVCVVAEGEVVGRWAVSQDEAGISTLCRKLGALEVRRVAIATSPPIAREQRSASVTLSGDVSGETAIVVGPVMKRRPGERLTGGDCIRAALGAAHSQIEGIPNIVGSVPLPTEEEKADAISAFTIMMIICLDYVKQQDKQAKSGALTPAVGAARTSCGLRTASLSVRVDRAAGTARYRSRRASRRGPSRRLRVSCRRPANGAVTVRVRTRSRRTKLRKVLGKRLVVGAYRLRSASGTANVQTTFKRR